MIEIQPLPALPLTEMIAHDDWCDLINEHIEKIYEVLTSQQSRILALENEVESMKHRIDYIDQRSPE